MIPEACTEIDSGSFTVLQELRNIPEESVRKICFPSNRHCAEIFFSLDHVDFCYHGATTQREIHADNIRVTSDWSVLDHRCDVIERDVTQRDMPPNNVISDDICNTKYVAECIIKLCDVTRHQ